MAKAGYKGLVEYLNDTYFNLLSEAAANYVRYHGRDFTTEYIPFTTAPPEVGDCRITSLYTEALPNDYVCLHCNVNVEVIITGHVQGKRKGGIEQDTCQLWLSMNLKAKFVDTFEGMKVVDCRLLEDKERFQMRSASTSSFVPYIKEEDLEYHAQKFLEKYYPEALKTPMPLSMRELTKRMRLKVLTGRLKGGIFGKCYFKDKKGRTKDGAETVIKRGTIVCDTNAFFFNGVGSLNNTIVHECVHWELHRKFFALMHLLNSSLSYIGCTVLGEDVKMFDPSLAESYKWMEWQANALAPRILMPAEMTKLKFEQIKAEEVIKGEKNFALIYQRTIDRLAAFFDVTVTSVKIRLLELGFDYLKGIHDYIDNKPTKPYLYNASKIKPEQSFSAGFVDAVVSSTFNMQLREALGKRTVVYANGFFVLNDRKYTYKDKESGRQELTDYALAHMDECCLVFDHERTNKSSFNDKYYSMCFLCRSQGNEFNSNINAADDHNSSILSRAANLDLSEEQAELDEAQRLIRSMNGSFAEALQFLMTEFGYSKHSLMTETRIDDHKIAKFLSDDGCLPSKREALALCAGMRLYPPVAAHFMRIAGVTLNLSTDVDLTYNFLLTTKYDEGLEAWDDQLDAANKSELKL